MALDLSRKVDLPLLKKISTPKARRWRVKDPRPRRATSILLHPPAPPSCLCLTCPFSFLRPMHCTSQRRGNDACVKKVPFFELDVQLSVPSVRLSPTLEDVQASINAAAASVLGCAKRLYDWGEADVTEAERFSFFEALGSDLEIVKTVLLLTGASYGTAVQASFVVNVVVATLVFRAGRLVHPMNCRIQTQRPKKGC